MHDSWFQALKSLPAGTVVHKQDIFLKKEYLAQQLPNSTFLEKATHDHFKGREFMEHESYLFFIWPKNKSLNKAKYVNPFKEVAKSIPDELSDSVKSFLDAVRDAATFSK